jgi:gamma-glutamylcyclotransferase (GGCT)/AIG2-like uncharacterized protein YtfP
MQRGCQNHERLHRVDVEFICNGLMVEPQVIHVTETNRVALIRTHGNTQHRYVIGELYHVMGGVLRDLDMCEGHPDVYRRTKTNVWALGDINNETEGMTGKVPTGDIVYTSTEPWYYELNLSVDNSHMTCSHYHDRMRTRFGASHHHVRSLGDSKTRYMPCMSEQDTCFKCSPAM